VTGDDLLAAIWDRPHDDLPRLAYADWLDDQGAPEQAARAEFIRVQCLLARLGEWADDAEPLEKREAALWRTWGKAWKAGLPVALRAAKFHRGFPAPRPQVLTVTAFAGKPAAAFAAAPLWAFELPAAPTRLGKLLDCPHLRRAGVAVLASRAVAGGFYDWLADAAAAERFATAPNARNVADLRVGGATAAVLAGLAAAGLPNLSRLGLGYRSRIGDAGLHALLASPLGGRLHALDLWGCRGLTAAGAETLFNHPGPAGLVRLTLPHDFDGAAIAAVAASRPAFRLRAFDLTRLQDDTAVGRLLAGWPGLAGVRHLGVTRWAGDLLRSLHLTGLRSLELVTHRVVGSDCPLLDELADPAVLPALRELHIHGSIDDAGRTARLRERFGGRLVLS
jgi:uncharacterized protein (TIGR02996 family)